MRVAVAEFARGGLNVTGIEQGCEDAVGGGLVGGAFGVGGAGGGVDGLLDERNEGRG